MLSACDYIQYDEPAHKESLLRCPATHVDNQELLRKWIHLLHDSERTQDVPSFLDHYPHVLPGFREHHPQCGIVVLSLPFGNDYIPDFFFAAKKTDPLPSTLVKIKKPSDKIFYADLSSTGEFVLALQLIRSWKSGSQENMKSFSERMLHA